MTVFDIVNAHRLLPVVEIREADTAAELAATLIAAELPILEITLRTPAGIPAIREVARSQPKMTLAAGTVVTEEQAKQAVDAGAQLIVSPGLGRSVVEYCLAHSVPVLPGICTPTEVEMARGYGLSRVKFFPAEVYGGVRTLKALSSVYADFSFVPTGGVNLDNLGTYLALPTVPACGGTWIAPAKQIAERQFDTISQTVRDAVSFVRSLS